MTSPTRPNRLLREKSPYLLQHARNPVDWHPWGTEAFSRAAAEGKFVFLSIGYSTCHWCHVMERESFEDEEAAAVLNDHCVCVKVDREERPDLDQVYMSVCQAMTGRGGWPLTVFLTPEAVPFFAGTYFPKTSRGGQIGLVDLVHRAAALWKEDRAALEASGRQLLERLREPASASHTPAGVDEKDFRHAEATFRQLFDATRGGFGTAPKFPTPHNLTFLLGRYRRTGDSTVVSLVEHTLDAMAAGGLFDHLGFGFHRYSTDDRWLLPHFEKMLYDQAGLALAYLEAYQATGKDRFAETARHVFAYVQRDLAGPGGAFCSAEDADSEGVEGKFYVWTRAEIQEVLGPAEGDVFCSVFGVAEKGNFREEATREASSANVLHRPQPLAASAVTFGLPEAELSLRLERSRERLLEQRAGRVRPHRDDKVLAGWNGFMISALARGAAVLGDEAYAAAAGRAADFLLGTLRRDGRLLRRYRDGEAAIPGFAEDYAFVARGLLDLYAATFDPPRLAQALDLARELVRLFWDEAGEGLFDTASDAEALVVRPKEAYDGATPSANSVALEVFARLWLLTGDPGWETRARGILQAFAGPVRRSPAAFPQFLRAASLLLEPTREVVVVGAPGAADTAALLAALHRAWAPETVALFAVQGSSELAELAPFTAGMRSVGGRAAAYVCEGFACREPLTDPRELADLLAAPP
ncbi:MAG: thioredoxin domain-containing protein [Deltaproteobacteria bacterium]|nr:thioredoxin domain-containing protein [Deltaproteobacteria bacterium]